MSCISIYGVIHTVPPMKLVKASHRTQIKELASRRLKDTHLMLLKALIHGFHKIFLDLIRLKGVMELSHAWCHTVLRHTFVNETESVRLSRY